MITHRVGAIVLAAGGSSRFGSPKQLLHFKGRSLVRNAAMAALEARCDPVVAVIGAAADEVAAELHGLLVELVMNRTWAVGMGSSIKAGVEALLRVDPPVGAGVIVLSDQPHLTGVVIENLIAQWARSGKAAAVSLYAPGTFGPPCCFDRASLQSLLTLPDRAGGKSILRTDSGGVQTVPWPDGCVDVDTPEDWAVISTSARG